MDLKIHQLPNRTCLVMILKKLSLYLLKILTQLRNRISKLALQMQPPHTLAFYNEKSLRRGRKKKKKDENPRPITRYLTESNE